MVGRLEVSLCVQDNGIGIDVGDLQRISEKGFTGRNGRNVPQNSTDIGLYLCKRLCDKLEIGIEFVQILKAAAQSFDLSFMLTILLSEGMLQRKVYDRKGTGNADK